MVDKVKLLGGFEPLTLNSTSCHSCRNVTLTHYKVWFFPVLLTYS
jgi:hypothetical protein